MPLPLLPGLQAGADDPTPDDSAEPVSSPLADFLDGLDDSQIQELVAAADDYDQANPDAAVDPDADPEAPPADDDAPPDDPDAPPADDADSDAPPAEGDDAEASPQDLDAVDKQMDVDIQEAATVCSQLEELAGGDSDSAPDVAKLLKQASGLSDKIDKQRKVLDKALKNEDVQAAAQAGMDANDALSAMQALLVAAQALGTKTEAPAMKPGDHPAIKAWAAKVQGKKPAPAPFGG